MAAPERRRPDQARAESAAARLRALLLHGEDGEVELATAAFRTGRRRLLSPLEVHFSQSHIRPDFQDGRPVEEVAAALRQPGPKAHRQRLPRLRPGEDALWEEAGAPAGAGFWWLLTPPFPEVEVIQWRCKLRDEAGGLRLDEAGCELYGEREWYTLDNRRLYCLQRAAAALYPEEVRIVVTVIHQEEGNYREFRKFRTADRGRTVAIGHRDSPDLPRWSWRQEVGLPEEVLSTGTAISKPPRLRRGPNGGRNGPPSGGRGADRQEEDDDEDEGRERWEFGANAFIFVLVYVGLRVAFFAGRHLFAAARKDDPASTTVVGPLLSAQGGT